MVEFIDKTNEENGTPINRNNLMAVQGFNDKTTVFENDGSVVETNTKTGEVLTTVFSKNNIGEDVITETFVGDKTITKTTTFRKNGIIEEVIS